MSPRERRRRLVHAWGMISYYRTRNAEARRDVGDEARRLGQVVAVDDGEAEGIDRIEQGALARAA